MHLPRFVLRLPGSLLLVLLTVSQCQSQLRAPQVEITNADTVGYAFVRDEANQIENRDYLEPFFQKLYLQRTQGGHKVSVVQIGDSHILADLRTGEVRKRMQREFGDAGRGLIFPYKLAGSNGPKDYLVSSSLRWDGANCVRTLTEQTEFGLSGFSAITHSPKGDITFRLRDTANSVDRTFTKVTLFHRNTEQGFGFQLRDNSTAQKADPVVEDDFSQSFYFNRPVEEFTISVNKKDAKQKEFWLDGISLENELSGVIYHNIGVNGAKFSDYARAKYFARQLRELTPDLVILSFGTNEGQASPDRRVLYRQMEELTQQILSQWPHTRILLTTPADSYLRGKGFNPYIPEVCSIIRGFAKEKGYALWDLNLITGGANSAEAWKSRGLMSSDSVHYSKAGYAVQGKLLYQGLIKGYNEVAARQMTVEASGGQK